LPPAKRSSASAWPKRTKALTIAGLLPAPVKSSASFSPGTRAHSMAREAAATEAERRAPPMSGSALTSPAHFSCVSRHAATLRSAAAVARAT